MWYIFLIGYIVIGLITLWLSIAKLEYDYNNAVQPIFIIILWPIILIAILIVFTTGSKMAEDIEEEEKQRDIFKHP